MRALLADDLRVEEDLGRWFPVWGAPGLDGTERGGGGGGGGEGEGVGG